MQIRMIRDIRENKWYRKGYICKIYNSISNKQLSPDDSVPVRSGIRFGSTTFSAMT